MVVAGVPEAIDDHLEEIAKLALSMMKSTAELKTFAVNYNCVIRIGKTIENEISRFTHCNFLVGHSYAQSRKRGALKVPFIVRKREIGFQYCSQFSPLHCLFWKSTT